MQAAGQGLAARAGWGAPRAAPGIWHLPGDEARLGPGSTDWPSSVGPIAGQGCEDLESDPAVASVGKGLMSLGG